MSDKFHDKYRIPSARLQSWDYRWAGAYFITICTKNKEHSFGEIENDQMQWTPIGAVAHVLWHEIKHHAQNVDLDAFVVMPNHIHGILILNGDQNAGNAAVQTGHALSPGHALVETGHALSLPGQHRFQHIGKNSVSSIIGSYKSAVTKHAHRLGFDFQWHERFHDHIIRDQKSFEKIQTYIIENPVKWKDDKYFDN